MVNRKVTTFKKTHFTENMTKTLTRYGKKVDFLI